MSFFSPSSTAIFYFDHYDDIIKGRLTSNCVMVHEQIFKKYTCDLFCIELFSECVDQFTLKIRYVIENEIFFNLEMKEFNIIMSVLRPLFITFIVKNSCPFMYIQDKRSEFLQISQLLSELIEKYKNIGK